MSLLSYTEICELIESGVIHNASYSDVNSASLDLHLGHNLLLESEHTPQGPDSILYLDKKSQLPTSKVSLEDAGLYVMAPGEFLLAQSVEVFNLPNWISTEYKLKSSMARIGLEHLNAGWCDAGWHGSVLTLEMKNMLQYHRIALKQGVAIGQMVFFKHRAVPEDKSYSVRGSYNNDTEVQGVKTK